jgi:hypothetical protein
VERGSAYLLQQCQLIGEHPADATPGPTDAPSPDKPRVHLLHIGKTGGMAVKFALRQFLTAGSHQIVLRKHTCRLKLVPPGEKVVFFLRDPLTRFVSGFYSRQRKGRPGMFFPWHPLEKLAFSHFSTPNQLALALTSGEWRQQRRARRAMRCIMHVNMPICWWFGSPQDFQARLPDIFFVGFQESLAEDFTRLRVMLDLPETAALPKDEIKAHKNPTHLDRTLESQAEANLKEWYQDDYKFIAFCRKYLNSSSLGGITLKSKTTPSAKQSSRSRSKRQRVKASRSGRHSVASTHP